MTSRILILDFGSQFTQLIARRVREAGVYSEIHPPTRSAEWVREWNPTGIILSGGPNSVYDDGRADGAARSSRLRAHARRLLRDESHRAPAAAARSRPRIAASTAARS